MAEGVPLSHVVDVAAERLLSELGLVHRRQRLGQVLRQPVHAGLATLASYSGRRRSPSPPGAEIVDSLFRHGFG